VRAKEWSNRRGLRYADRDLFPGAAQKTQLMAATTNGAAISRTGHSRNIRRPDYYLQFAF
jgi:hypothetical protein